NSQGQWWRWNGSNWNASTNPSAVQGALSPDLIWPSVKFDADPSQQAENKWSEPTFSFGDLSPIKDVANGADSSLLSIASSAFPISETAGIGSSPIALPDILSNTQHHSIWPAA